MEIIKTSANYIGIQGIYAIINTKKVTKYCKYGFPYVGQAMSRPFAKKHKLGIGARLRDHKWSLRNGFHRNNKLARSWNKYGESSFIFGLLEVVEDLNDLTSREQFWIDSWQSYKYGFNLQPIADSSRGLFHRTLLTDEIICEWIEKYYLDNGKYPHNQSGKVDYAKIGEPLSWAAVNEILSKGFRNVKGGRTLSRFIADKFGILNKTNSKLYTIEKILDWVALHYSKFGKYPNKRSGIVENAIKDGYCQITWDAIDRALRVGNKGLPGKMSLFGLIKEI